MMSLRSIRIICVLIGVLVAVMTAIMIPSDILFLKNSQVAEGTVIQINSSSGNVSYRPVVAFQTKTGQEVRAENPVNASPKLAIPQIGEKVQVYYRPEEPSQFRLINFKVDLIYLSLGALLLVAFCYLHTLGRALKNSKR